MRYAQLLLSLPATTEALFWKTTTAAISRNWHTGVIIRRQVSRHVVTDYQAGGGQFCVRLCAEKYATFTLWHIRHTHFISLSNGSRYDAHKSTHSLHTWPFPCTNLPLHCCPPPFPRFVTFIKRRTREAERDSNRHGRQSASVGGVICVLLLINFATGKRTRF